MATYSTDLTTFSTADAVTGWVELSGYTSGGAPSNDTENFIQGTACTSQSTGQALGMTISLGYNTGADQSGTFGTNDCVFLWCYYGVGTNLDTYANAGYQFAIQDTGTNVARYTIGGSNYGRNPYGGWFNAVVDPTRTPDAGTTLSTYQYFGAIVNTLAKITKGNPHACDAVRWGRGELSITGSGGSFTELASYNDWNSTATPPGTSSTVVDSGYHRFGLFQDQGGTFLWKGLLSFGLTATSVTFSDSNKTIIIDDAAKTFTTFNKVEVNNASSSVTWTNITFIALGTTAPGYFEMIDNATVSFDGCSFNNMGTFVYQSNGTTTNSTFNSTGLITVGGSTLTGCTFNKSSDTTKAVYASAVSHVAGVTGCKFVSTGTGHGLQIGDGTTVLSTQTINITSLDFSGYDTANPGTAANKAIWVNSGAGGGTVTLNISGGTGISQNYHVRATNCTVVVSADVTVTFRNLRANSEVRVYKTSDNSVVGGIENATTADDLNPGRYKFSWSAPATTSVYYVIHNWSSTSVDYLPIRKEGYIVPGSNTDVNIDQIIDRNSV